MFLNTHLYCLPRVFNNSFLNSVLMTAYIKGSIIEFSISINMLTITIVRYCPLFQHIYHCQCSVYIFSAGFHPLYSGRFLKNGLQEIQSQFLSSLLPFVLLLDLWVGLLHHPEGQIGETEFDDIVTVARFYTPGKSVV